MFSYDLKKQNKKIKPTCKKKQPIKQNTANHPISKMMLQAKPQPQCRHGLAKTDCTMCGLACEHTASKILCTVCQAHMLCAHGRWSTSCWECYLSGAYDTARPIEEEKPAVHVPASKYARCKHDKLDCKQCGGRRICKHMRYRRRCIECNGNDLCKHGVSKHNCRSCNGSSFCEHSFNKHSCLRCKGVELCEPHGNRLTTCVKCKKAAK